MQHETIYAKRSVAFVFSRLPNCLNLSSNLQVKLSVRDSSLDLQSSSVSRSVPRTSHISAQLSDRRVILYEFPTSPRRDFRSSKVGSARLPVLPGTSAGNSVQGEGRSKVLPLAKRSREATELCAYRIKYRVEKRWKLPVRITSSLEVRWCADQPTGRMM